MSVASRPNPGVASGHLRGAMRQGGSSANKTNTELILIPLSPLSVLSFLRKGYGAFLVD